MEIIMKYINIFCILINIYISLICASDKNNAKKLKKMNPFGMKYGHQDNANAISVPKVIDLNLLSQNADRGPKCWMTLNAKSLFDKMDQIDGDYYQQRQAIQKSVDDNHFDETMMSAFIESGGAAVRDLYKARQQRHQIPAGLNLGGYCMMRMWDSVLFFHRVKLRNQTQFTVNYLKNDLANMTLTLRLSLNDLHLLGAYERSLVSKDPSVLLYTPTFGQAEFLLKDVTYNAEGRYRLIHDRLSIEMLVSEIKVPKAIIKINNTDSKLNQLKEDNLAEFVDRVKTDLDKWLKDYFNDFLIYTELTEFGNLDGMRVYDKKRQLALDEFMDNSLQQIRKQAHAKNALHMKQPNFNIIGQEGFQVKMYDGIFLGLDSIYRRSVTTSKTDYDDKNIRFVDSLVGFSDLKIVYKYDALIPTGLPPVSGHFILSANDLTAHLELVIQKDTDAVDLNIEFIDQTRPESLTVQGSANVLIANFKHLLEHEILSIMTNTLFFSVKKLKQLPKCEPKFYSSDKSAESDQDYFGGYDGVRYLSDDEGHHPAEVVDDDNVKDPAFEKSELLQYHSMPNRKRLGLKKAMKKIKRIGKTLSKIRK